MKTKVLLPILIAALALGAAQALAQAAIGLLRDQTMQGCIGDWREATSLTIPSCKNLQAPP